MPDTLLGEHVVHNLPNCLLVCHLSTVRSHQNVSYVIKHFGRINGQSFNRLIRQLLDLGGQIVKPCTRPVYFAVNNQIGTSPCPLKNMVRICSQISINSLTTSVDGHTLDQFVPQRFNTVIDQVAYTACHPTVINIPPPLSNPFRVTRTQHPPQILLFKLPT